MEPAETHPDRLIDFWEWLVENRRQVVLAIFVVFAVVVGVYINRQSEQLAEEEAGEGRGDAEPNEEPGDAPDEETTAEPPKAADAATATVSPACTMVIAPVGVLFSPPHGPSFCGSPRMFSSIQDAGSSNVKWACVLVATALRATVAARACLNT